MFVLLACATVSLPDLGLAPSGAVLFHDVAVYPGFGAALIPHQDVLIDEGRIQQMVGSGSVGFEGIERVAGAGLTLLPGLVDAHVHLTAPVLPPWKPALPHAEETAGAWLRAGVTTVYDLGGDPAVFERLGRSQAPLPRIFHSGGQVSFPGAHPAVVIRDLAGPAAALVLAKLTLIAEPAQARIAIALLEGDLVKVIYDALPADAPHMPYAVLESIVLAAHGQQKVVFVHIGTIDDALDAARAGADVLAHGVYRGGLTREEAEALRGLTVIPTLFAFEGSAGLVQGSLTHPPLEQAILGDALSYTTGEEGKRLLGYPSVAAFLGGIDPAMGVGVRTLWEAGVPLVVGSDAPLPGVVPGAAVHRELQAWVDAGIPPAVALEGATGRAAGLVSANPDFGTIAPGKVADLLLVRGDPLQDIGATQAIERVYRAGQRVTW